MRKMNSIKWISLMCLTFTMMIADSISAQVVLSYDFVHATGGSGDDATQDVITDAAGNIYAIGKFSSNNIDFDPGPGVMSKSSAGSSDVFVTKYNGKGQLIWMIQIGGTGEDKGQSITLDNNGKIWICGSFSNTVDFNPGSGTNSLTSSGSTDAFIAKYDTSGAYTWAGKMGGTGDEMANKICHNRSNNIVVCGTFTGTADFNPGAGTSNLTSNGAKDAFLASFNNTGTFISANSFGSSFDDEATSITTLSNNDMVVIGTYRGTVDFDPGVNNNSLSSYFGGVDGYIAKFTSSHNFSWVKPVKGNGSKHLTDIETDTSNYIVICGYFSDSISFIYDNFPNYSAVADGICNGFLLSVTPNGDGYAGVKIHRSISGEWVKHKALSIDKENNIHVIGHATGDFDAAPYSYDTAIVKVENSAIYTLEFDIVGNIFLHSTIAKEGDEIDGLCIDVDNNLNVILGGFFAGTTNFDPNFGFNNKNSSNGSNDAFVSKYYKCGLFDPDNYNFNGDEVCSGKSTTVQLLTGAFGVTFSWYSDKVGGKYLGENLTTPPLTSNTPYYLQDSFCNITRRTEVIVKVIPLPSNNVVQNGLTLTADSGNYIYQWYDCNNNTILQGETNRSFTAQNSGRYYVKITDASTNCDQNSNCFDITKVSVEHLNKLGLNVYPQPCSNTLNLSTDIETDYKIIDLNGKILLNGKTEKGHGIDVSALNNGLYMIQFGDNTFIKFTVIKN